MFGQGRAAAITNNDIAALAKEIGCHPATLEAIAQVESSGFGWFPDGRIKLLCEKHKFYQYLPESMRAEAVRRGLARKAWISPKNGGYKEQGSADQRYKIFEDMLAYHREAGFKSASYGTYQIMGFNYATCGFTSPEAMWEAFLDSEANQLEAFGNFLVKNGLRDELRLEQFEKIEEVYNGGGLNGTYAAKMREASKKLKAGKWAGWPTTWPGKNTPLTPPPAPAIVAPAPAPVVERPKQEVPPAKGSGFLGSLKRFFGV